MFAVLALDGRPRHDLAAAMAMMASPSPDQVAAGERHGVINPMGAVHRESARPPD
jgi:hypothetical protein